MSVTINGTSGVTTPGINNSEGYTGDGLTIAANAPAGAVTVDASGNMSLVLTGTPLFSVRSTSITGAAIMAQDNGGTAYFYNYNTSGWINIGTYGPVCTFSTNNTERMRLDASGNLLVGTTSSTGRFTVSGSGGTTYCASVIQDSGTGNVLGVFGPTNGTTQNLIVFAQAGNVKGTISTNGATTSYNTSSDYRLKENVAPLTNALDTIAALKPCSFTWKADGSADRGFIAHELQEIIPQAVSGEKDAVDSEGNIMPQGVDYGKITPEIVAAIQELKARIEQLEAK